MSDGPKIHYLDGSVRPVDGPAPNEDLIASLTEALEAARGGRLRAGAFAGVLRAPDGNYTTYTVVTHDPGAGPPVFALDSAVGQLFHVIFAGAAGEMEPTEGP